MSLDNTEPITSTNNLSTETVIPRRRKPTAENGPARIRREAIALDGQMFESLESGSLNERNPTLEKRSEGVDQSNDEDNTTETTSDNGKSEDMTYDETNDLRTSRLSSSSLSSSPTASSPDTSSPSELLSGSSFRSSQLLAQTIGVNMPSSSELAVPISRNRQSMFLGDHIIIEPDIPSIESPSSQSANSNDASEDMKEVQIETSNPSHLFWVPFHLHPEIAPNEYNRWLSKHGVDNTDSDGTQVRRNGSVSRRKSVLSTQYNPEDDREEPPSVPKTITEESRSQEFLSALSDQSSLKTRTSLRRSVSLSVSSPTRESFPLDVEEESIMAVKRLGGLERGGLSLLRRSARTKIRRNSTASNEVRHSASRLRSNTDDSGEHQPVSLVDLGPQPRLSLEPEKAAPEDVNTTQKSGDAQPSKRFVSTLRDPSKPTITTYVEPHLLEQQRKESEDANKGESPTSFRISAPAKLESPATEYPSIDVTEKKETLDKNYTVSYPIPPPVKLSQNLLQQPLSQQPPSPKPSATQPVGKQRNSGQEGGPTHAKKPSTWSWLWGKEKGNEKATDSLSSTPTTSLPHQNKPVSTPISQVSSAETSNQSLPTADISAKKQSTFAMLFSRNGKSTSSTSLKPQANTIENTNGLNVASGQSPSKDKPKYTNYNRLPIHIERAIYRLSHVKLANPRRPLHEQVLISNMMFWYLGVIQQQQLIQQQTEQQQMQQQVQKSKDNTKDDLKEQKAKSKSKRKKSQKKKSQSSSPSGKGVKSNDYEKKQQQQQQQSSTTQAKVKGQLNQAERDRTRSSSLDSLESGARESEKARQLSRQQNGSLSDTPTALSSPRDTQIDDEEDDDVPLAHYQNMPRQTVPVS